MSKQMNRMLRLCFIFILLFTSLPGTRVEAAKSSPYILRVIAHDCKFDPPSRQLTGFRVKGTQGVITALHGIVDCSTISALKDDSARPYADLVPRKVDIDRDIVLVSSSEVDHEPTNGLEIGYVPDSKYVSTFAVGYPDGLSHQLQINSMYMDTDTLRRIIPDKYIPEMETRSSPSLKIQILELDASTTYGNSGGPLLTNSGKVIGMIDGGLNGKNLDAPHDTSWAIPLKDVQWRTIRSVRNQYEKLANWNPASVVAFSQPKTTDEDITFKPIYRENTSYRSNTFLRFYSRSNPTKPFGSVKLETAFDSLSNQKYLALTTNLPLFGLKKTADSSEISVKVYTVGGKYYATSTITPGQCTVADQNPDSAIEQIQGFMDSLYISHGDRQGVLLGREKINGVDTNHYLLSPSGDKSSLRDDGVQFTEVKGGEFWLTTKGNYLMRGTIEASFSLDSESSNGFPRSGNAIETVDFYDIARSVSISLPSECKKAANSSGSVTSTQVPSPELLNWVAEYMKQAAQAEITAYYYGNDSMAASYYGGDALFNIKNKIAELNKRGLVEVDNLDNPDNMIYAVHPVNSRKIKVDLCMYYSSSLYVRNSGAFLTSVPSTLLPQTLTMEQSGANWFITQAVFYDPPSFCQ